ncbi:MAG: DUF4412 domain-containing protein [Helicobacteraceae bacterium]|jgi:hypothetical protein|nr:DUF4412 domain-containing protein [Helicobacteraceae bacterium]
MKNFSKFVLGVGAFFLIAPAVFAGWLIEEAVTYEGGERFTSRVAIDGGRYASTSGDEKLIINFKTNTVYFVYEKSQQYFGGTIEQVANELRGSMIMTEMHEEQDIFAPTEAGLASGTDAAIFVEASKTGEKFTAAGFAGEKYQILVDGELKKEIFLAPTLTANKEIDARKLARVMLILSGASNPTGAKFLEMNDKYVELMKIGYPIRTLEYDPSGGLVLTSVVKAEQKALPDSEFTPPKEYKKAKSADIYRVR